MINPNLEENKNKTSIHTAGPSISVPPGHAKIHKKLVSNKSASTALKNLAKNRTKKITTKNQSSTQHFPHQPISGKVKHLIEKEIFENNKKQIDVAKTFGTSEQQLKTDIATSILLLLEEESSTTLKKLTEHLKSNHNIQVSPGEIQKMLKTIDVTWNTVTPIPNEAAFLQEQHDYSGFNSQTHPLYGYSLTGQAAILKKNARGLMINLVGAMSEEGIIYFELLNKDEKKKTGTTLNDIWEFFNQQTD
ncbi:hypothetical protein VP01_2422g4 [Puccinia sorghi]|uniref:Uncharacterized protein n=1 Tax=Puccinia sorghi TaxID=27349 RepID=A0A0L6V8D4_9BASI|nr:hypothetical protein VP01_2422g4 [Puccinia sorghi]